LEVELLLQLCPDDRNVIYRIVDLIVGTYSAKHKMLKGFQKMTQHLGDFYFQLGIDF